MFLEHLPTETKNAQGALDVLCYVICIDMWRLSVCKWGNRAQNSLSNQDTRAESLTEWNLWQQGFLQGGKSPGVRSCHLWPHGQLYSEANYNVLWEVDDHRATLHHRPCRFLHYPGQWFCGFQRHKLNQTCHAYCEMVFFPQVGYDNQSDWWFGTCFLIFPHIGKNHSNWRTHIFQRDWHHQPAIYFCFIVQNLTSHTLQ